MHHILLNYSRNSFLFYFILVYFVSVKECDVEFYFIFKFWKNAVLNTTERVDKQINIYNLNSIYK